MGVFHVFYIVQRLPNRATHYSVKTFPYQQDSMLFSLMMMNYFCGMADRRKAFSLISSRDHCQRSSPSWISDTPRAGFEPAQNLSSGLVEWNCAVVITTTPRRQLVNFLLHEVLRKYFRKFLSLFII